MRCSMARLTASRSSLFLIGLPTGFATGLDVEGVFVGDGPLGQSCFSGLSATGVFCCLQNVFLLLWQAGWMYAVYGPTQQQSGYWAYC